MNSVIETYFANLEQYLIENQNVDSFDILRKDISLSEGKIRLKIVLSDKSMLDVFEYVVSFDTSISLKKYGYHWQNLKNELIKRWDNAPHHPDLENYPHHIHLPDSVLANYNLPVLKTVLQEIETSMLK